VTPAIAARLEAADDRDSAAILDRILADEIGHVAIGRRGFDYFCRHGGHDPQTVFHDRGRRYFKGELKPPFNRADRDATGMPAAYYESLASEAVGTG
jgi:uncharacterized ferritin-like protein (DUF455 family)